MFGCCYAAVAVRTEDQAEVLEAVDQWFDQTDIVGRAFYGLLRKARCFGVGIWYGLLDRTHVQPEATVVVYHF